MQSLDRAVIWSDDFSTASNWSIGNENDPNNDNWVIGTTAPSGAFAIPPIASTSASNGFALFDSDLLCGGSQNAWVATANPINLSAYPGVVLQFEQYYRNFQGFTYVETSTNGTTWSTIEVNSALAVNAASPNPELLFVDLSDAIGGAATAWIRFRYQGGCDYSWMVDDVSLTTLPAYEMIAESGYAVPFGGGYEYGRIPVSQMSTSVSVGAQVVNFGSEAQTNVTLTTTVTGPGGATIGTATENLSTMNHNDTVVTEETITFPSPAPVGLYTFTYVVSSDDIASDEDMANNTVYRYLEVTDDLYSLDGINAYPDSIVLLTTMGTGSFTDNTQDVRFLNYYTVTTQETFTGVEILLSVNNTDPGSYFIAAVYDTSEAYVGTLLSNPLVESDIRVITQDDIDNGSASVAFIDPITLSPNAYFVAVRVYEEGGNALYVLDDITVGQPADASMLWIPNDDQAQFIYGNGNAMAIRLSSSSTIGVQEIPTLTGVTMYPSPTNGPVEIRVENPSKMNVEVFNALGKLVQTASFNGTRTTLDLSGNAAGMYTVRVSDGARTNTQRIALK
ncbi:MAG: T9SS type A sorting domain-containing protein [Flavobacteriales bacterium]|nr:T9SS type A sorting domain-containing protein [Flavobacteriales bacterium]